MDHHRSAAVGGRQLRCRELQLVHPGLLGLVLLLGAPVRRSVFGHLPSPPRPPVSHLHQPAAARRRFPGAIGQDCATCAPAWRRSPSSVADSVRWSPAAALSRPPEPSAATAATTAGRCRPRLRSRQTPASGRYSSAAGTPTPARVRCCTRRTGDLVLTAAHCLADGIEPTSCPAFQGEADSSAMWRVTAVYLDPRWVAEPGSAGRLRDRAGEPGRRGADRSAGGFGVDASAPHPAPGSVVTVTGYPLGVGGGPVGCRRHHRCRRRRVSVAGVRGTGRRHQRSAVDHRFDGHRCDRRPRRRRLR